MEYPPHLLYLGMLIHTAPRMLGVEGNVSRVVSAGRGVLPGCSQSTPRVKIYVYEALEAAHYQ
eukprot:7886897-Pyramimonas_sp.AAC.1